MPKVAADSVWFNPTAGGLGDFVVASAVAGYRTPATAAIPNGSTIHYTARTATEFENGEGVYNSSTVTLSRASIFASSNANAKVNFASVPSVAITPLAEDTVFAPQASADSEVLAWSGTAGKELKRTGWIVVTPQMFGAVGDGSTDDTTALNNFFASFVAGGSYLIPKGTYRFTSALTIPATNNFHLSGDSQETTKLNYNGATTTINLLTFGNTSTISHHCDIGNFTIASDTTMTAGIGILLYHLEMSNVHNIGADSVIYGTFKLWHGIRFEKFHITTVHALEATAQRDGLQVVGDGADLQFWHLNIAQCRVGVRVGGGADNVHFASGNVQANAGEGVSIDQTILNDVNMYTWLGRQLVVGDNCNSAGIGQAGVLIDSATTGGNTSRINLDGYYSGTLDSKPGIYIKTANQQQITIAGAVQGNTGDGIRNDSTNSVIQLASSADIRGNSGWGFNNVNNSFLVRGNAAVIEFSGLGPWNGTRSQRRSKFGPDDTTLFVRANLGTFTVTIASPAVFTKASHGLQIDDPVVFSTTGALPTGLTQGTTYYVIAAGFTTGAFRVSASFVAGGGGAAVNTSGTQSGTHSVCVGNDNWEGNAAARGDAFLSIQGAIDYVMGNIDLQTSDIVIQCADSFYNTGGTVVGQWSGSGRVTIQGNATTPANCVISVTANYGFQLYDGARLRIGGFKFAVATSGAGVYAYGLSQVDIISKCDFGACAWYGLFADQKSRITSAGIAQNISGGGQGFAAADNESYIEVSAAAIVTSNTPAWSFAFANSWDKSEIRINGNTFSGTGGTGKRYDVTNGSLIYTGGAGATYLPGNASGTGTNYSVSPWGLYI